MSSNIQVTLVQIDNYGPWTVTPEPRREMDLQTLQSRLFADVAQFVGNRDGYAFSTRYDNMIAITNGMDEDDHLTLQETLRNRYPITVSLGVATDSVPMMALTKATNHIQRSGSAQDSDRVEVFEGDTLDESDRSSDDLYVAHFDVENATGKYTNKLNEFETFNKLTRGYSSVMDYMQEFHGALSFFVGGDNYISICPRLGRSSFEDALEYAADEGDVELRVGVGSGRTVHDAGIEAKHELEECRHCDEEVSLGFPYEAKVET